MLNVYLGNGLPIETIEDRWLDRLSYREAVFGSIRSITCPRRAVVGRSNKLPHGVCSLTVNRGTPILQHIYGAIQEYSGIDQPTWLDGHY